MPTFSSSASVKFAGIRQKYTFYTNKIKRIVYKQCDDFYRSSVWSSEKAKPNNDSFTPTYSVEYRGEHIQDSRSHCSSSLAFASWRMKAFWAFLNGERFYVLADIGVRFVKPLVDLINSASDWLIFCYVRLNHVTYAKNLLSLQGFLKSQSLKTFFKIN